MKNSLPAACPRGAQRVSRAQGGARNGGEQQQAGRRGTHPSRGSFACRGPRSIAAVRQRPRAGRRGGALTFSVRYRATRAMRLTRVSDAGSVAVHASGRAGAARRRAQAAPGCVLASRASTSNACGRAGSTLLLSGSTLASSISSSGNARESLTRAKARYVYSDSERPRGRGGGVVREAARSGAVGPCDRSLGALRTLAQLSDADQMSQWNRRISFGFVAFEHPCSLIRSSEAG